MFALLIQVNINKQSTLTLKHSGKKKRRKTSVSIYPANLYVIFLGFSHDII